MTKHFKTSLVKNSDNLKYKTQIPCNENQSLKFTDLCQTQRFIESWSISTALVPYSLRFSQVHWYYNSNIIPKLFCIYRNHVAILRKKNTRTQTHKNKTATKQTKTATTDNSPCLHHRWRYYQAIPLNDQQIGPTSLALLSS